jgi:hypothetical protein
MRTGTAPSLTNEAGTACYGDGSTSSFAGVASVVFWSSSTFEDLPDGAWFANLINGFVSSFGKDSPLRVWPVRGGQ